MKKLMKTMLGLVFTSGLLLTGSVYANEDPFVEKQCMEWSPSAESVPIGTSFTQTKKCNDETRTRAAYGVSQKWAGNRVLNYDWTSIGGKYACTQTSSGETCSVEQERSTVRIDRDAVSGMVKISGVDKSSAVHRVTESSYVAPPPPVTTPPEPAPDKVVSTSQECSVKGTTSWTPSLTRIPENVLITQTRSVEETCVTHQKWSSGKTTSLPSSKTSGTETRKEYGMLREQCGTIDTRHCQ
jgi:hypothetical protein